MRYVFIGVACVIAVIYYLGTLSHIKAMENGMSSIAQTMAILTGETVDSTIEYIPEGHPKEYYDDIQ